MTNRSNMIPIAGRLHSVAEDEPVCGANEVYDDNLGVTLDKLSVKSATSGTTGDNPYDGMGRKVLPKNMVSDVNTLTQSMMPTATGGNTIYVIKYDFILGEDITVPANCVLEFDGGSFANGSGNNYTMTLNNTTFKGENIVFTDIALSGTLTNKTIKLSWVGGSISRMLGIDPTDHVIAFDVDTVADATINYSNKNNIVFDGCNKEITVGADTVLFALAGEYSNIEIKNFEFRGTTTSTFFGGSSGWNVIHENIHIHHNNINTCLLGISLNSDLLGESINCSVHDNVIRCNQTTNVIGSYGIHLANANFSNFYNNYVSGCCRHAFYHAWGHDNNIFNNVFEDNDIGMSGTVATLAIFRKSVNVNVYGNKFLNNNTTQIMVEHGAVEYDDEEHTVENRRTRGNLRNVNIYDNLFEAKTRIAVNGIMVGYYAETDYTYIEEQIKIHHNTFLAGADASIYNSIVLTSGKNIEVTNNLFIWEDGDNFKTLKSSHTVITFRQNSTLAVPAQDIFQDFTIKNNVFEGPDITDFTYYPFFMENLREGSCFTNGLIKDNVMRGLFEINEDTSNKSNINPTIFPKADDAWLKIGNTSQRPALTENTKWFEYYDYEVGKPIYWCYNNTTQSYGWIDATGATV